MNTTKTLRDFQKQSKIGLIYNWKIFGLYGTFTAHKEDNLL